MPNSCRTCGRDNTKDPEGWCLGCGESFSGSASFKKETESLLPRERIIVTSLRNNPKTDAGFWEFSFYSPLIEIKVGYGMFAVSAGLIVLAFALLS